ncbi:UNVERIFIED_CONTAM: hypothetical protein PYX00_005467 [Menopon gallinae]
MKSDGPHSGILRKCPSNREKGGMLSVEDWLKAKEADDGAEGLWRVHDGIYDFTSFVKTHPGGKYWLEVTKGTDITEAFESHHISEKAENMLKKFWVKKATTPRMSTLTFHEDGFYKTLKRKVRKAKPVPFTGSTWESRMLIDGLLVCFLLTNYLGIYNYWWSILSGVFLYMVAVAAHNFFHMKDNLRMYYFNLSLLSFREWRISHSLSHHQYVNTLLDLEISLLEPIFDYLPKKDKNLLVRFLSWAYSPIVFCGVFHYEFFIKKILKLVFRQKTHFHWEEFLAFTVPLLTWLVSNEDPLKVFAAWNVTIVSGSFFFFLIGLTAAHHHPEIYHEGDYIGDDKDFGLFQLAAVRDREEVNGNYFLTMISFGEHALHHMFPTLDHRKLPALNPYLEETCKEFNVDYKLKTYANLVSGMYRQLARNYVNGRVYSKKLKH